MKSLTLMGLIGGLLMMSASAQADLLTLRADNGLGINVYYGLDAGTTGESLWSHATGVHVQVDHAIPGQTRVVLINKCVEQGSNRYEYTFDCEYGDDGTWLPRQCMLRGDSYSVNYYSSRYYGKVPVESANHGFSMRCTQEIAVELRPGYWLRDPVNGSHNFKFRFGRR